MQLNNQTDFNNFIAKIGLSPMSDSTIKLAVGKLRQDIASARIDPTSASRFGLPSFARTHIPLITHADWAKVKAKTVIACAIGGTNWKVSLVKKLSSGQVVYRELSTNVIPTSKRRHTPATFVQQIANEINHAIKNNLDVSTIDGVGIALGFPQQNKLCPLGIDAFLSPSSGCKGWVFTDFDRPGVSLANLLKSNLESTKDNNWQLKKIIFKNDTHATSEDGQTLVADCLPIGFVSGTGHNLVLEDDNLEIAKRPVKKDLVMQSMLDNQLITFQQIIEECYIGGEYLKQRLVGVLHLIARHDSSFPVEHLAKLILESNDKRIVSELAIGGAEITTMNLFDKYHTLLQILAVHILNQAGIYIGINLAAAISNTTYDGKSKAAIPAEGSVFWDGFGVKEKAMAVLKLIFPDNNLYWLPSLGMSGVGKVAMIHIQKERL